MVGNPGVSEENQRVMEAAGFNPIPVYHFGEPIEVLDDMVKRYPLVGLGGTVGQPLTTKEQFFRRVFGRYPQGRFHALGTTNERLITQFPFESVDSVWWVYKFRDKTVRLSQGTDRKSEQRARVSYLLKLQQRMPKYQPAMF